MSNYPLLVLYDGACPICKLEIDNFRDRDSSRLLRFVDISAPGFDPAPYGVPLKDMLTVIHALKPDGSFVKGVEVFQLAYGAIGFGWLTAPTAWPLLKPLFDAAYLHFARKTGIGFRSGFRGCFPAWLPGARNGAADDAAKGIASSEIDITT